MYYEELRSTIKEGKIAPLYIFEGAEEYLIEFCLGELKKALVEEWSEMMNFKSFAELPPVSEAEDFMETLPVMSERKLVIFRKCGLFGGNIKNKAQWEKLMSNVAPFNCVVIWESSDDKGKKSSTVRKAAEKGGAVVVEFPLRSEANLRSWVTKIAAADGKSIDPKNASYLINSLDRSMRSIKTELGKIIAFSKTPQITREDIDSVIVKPVTENVFALIDAIFDGRRELCYSQLYTLRSLREEPVAILSLLSGQLITIYKAKLHLLGGLNHSSVVSALGGGYLSTQCTRKAEKIKLENIQTLISLCWECDKNIKQGLIGGWAALETIVAEYKFY
ncbi:MAG: DNA polymerase III subunit delta [Clostridia bacterium]|nr:DNA polymerase III subunit delta [Clostridia bacterium]